MRFSEWLELTYIWIFGTGAFLPSAFLIATGITVAAGILSYRVNSGGVFFGMTSVLFGGLMLVFAWNKVPLSTITPFLALLIAVGGISYLLSFLCIRLRARAQRRKEERETQARALRFTLPDKDNSFVRARLNTVLQTEETDGAHGHGETDGEEIKLRFVYAWKLLARIKAAPLSPAERLEAEELSKIFGVYRQKDGFVTEDIRLVNEAFSRVLKLSAKYGV